MLLVDSSVPAILVAANTEARSRAASQFVGVARVSQPGWRDDRAASVPAELERPPSGIVPTSRIRACLSDRLPL